MPNTHRSLLLHLSLVLVFVYLCSLMEGQQNVQLPLGTTEWKHSYHTGNSFSASHSAQQSQNGTIATSVQPFAYTLEANGAASSGFVSSPLLPRSAISSQVPAGPTRNGTGDVMPLAEAITQLSFLEFFQRCGISIAPLHQSPFHSWTLLCRRLNLVTSLRMCPRRRLISRSPRYLVMWQCRPLPHGVHISSLDAAVQTIPHSTLSQNASTQTGRLAVRCYTMLPHNYRSRSSLLDVSSRTILWTAKTLIVSPCHQYKTILVVTHHL